jgi:Host cell surface-exposed lipoprotein
MTRRAEVAVEHALMSGYAPADSAERKARQFNRSNTVKKFLAMIVAVLAVLSLASAAQASTAGERNALSSAKSYLRSEAFSKSGLIKQLEFEHYSRSEAHWAVAHVRVSWNAEAVQSAKSYLRSSSFSRQGLIEQLEFEGFTHSQAVYGVRKAYR